MVEINANGMRLNRALVYRLMSDVCHANKYDPDGTGDAFEVALVRAGCQWRTSLHQLAELENAADSEATVVEELRGPGTGRLLGTQVLLCSLPVIRAEILGYEIRLETQDNKTIGRIFGLA